MSLGYEALRHGAAWIDLSARGRITVRGRDRARLLHAITSNEVKKMTPGTGCYAFLLSPQGRIQADLNLFCFEDHFLIDTEPELAREGPPAHQALHHRRPGGARRRHRADRRHRPGRPRRRCDPGHARRARPGDRLRARRRGTAATVAAVTVTGQPGVRIFCPAENAAALVRQLEAAGAVAATADEVAPGPHRKRQARATAKTSATPSLPQETQQMHAVSFTKGCYLGQEIVERIRAQGRVNKKLTRVVLPGTEAPAPRRPRPPIDGADAEVTSAICRRIRRSRRAGLRPHDIIRSSLRCAQSFKSSPADRREYSDCRCTRAPA